MKLLYTWLSCLPVKLIPLKAISKFLDFRLQISSYTLPNMQGKKSRKFWNWKYFCPSYWNFFCTFLEQMLYCGHLWWLIALTCFLEKGVALSTRTCFGMRFFSTLYLCRVQTISPHVDKIFMLSEKKSVLIMMIWFELKWRNEDSYSRPQPVWDWGVVVVVIWKSILP